jgi:segregation and condensation protein B
MNSLIDKGLIEACGRLDAPGRPMIYATTEKFLRVFGINSLEDLPQTESLEEIAKNEAEGVITMDIPQDNQQATDNNEETFENPAV